jgi:hypothetical protein
MDGLIERLYMYVMKLEGFVLFRANAQKDSRPLSSQSHIFEKSYFLGPIEKSATLVVLYLSHAI